MKKLFFLKFPSSVGGSKQCSPPKDKQVHVEGHLGKTLSNSSSQNLETSFRTSNGFSRKVDKSTYHVHSSDTSPALRRSLSFSSVAFNGNDGFEQANSYHMSSQSRSSTCCSDIPPQQCHFKSRFCTPESKMKAVPYEEAGCCNERQLQNSRSAGSCSAHRDSSQNSSLASSNVTSTVLDLYIDGEQQQKISKPKKSISQKNDIEFGDKNGYRKFPPRTQYTSPGSPVHDVMGRPRSRSFRESTGTQVYFTKDCMNELKHESHRKLAKHVIEKLSQSNFSTRGSVKDFDHDNPITVEDIYGGSFATCSGPVSASTAYKKSSIEPYEAVNLCHSNKVFGSQKQDYLYGEELDSIDKQDDIAVDLQRKLKEAQERFLFFSAELEEEKFLHNSRFDVPALVQTVRHLTEERISLSLQVLAALQGRIDDRTTAKENLRLAKLELESQTRRLEKEKNELQTALEKELDRRSSDWSFKLEKYQSEEQKLRERVRELAEHNVSLQREVSCVNEGAAENKNTLMHSASQLRNLTSKLEEVEQDNQNLQQNVSCLHDKYILAEKELSCFQKNYKEKEKECEELQKSVTELLRTCGDLEKTISGLREGLGEELEQKHSQELIENPVVKLQMEQVRLTGVEQALRREVESYKSEVDSLRHENIYLLNRLQVSGKESGFYTLKLDQELLSRVNCLQTDGLSLLNENTELCSKLLEFGKINCSHFKQCVEVPLDGSGRQFIVESDIKVQGFKRRIETIKRSLETMAALLHEKPNIVSLKCQSNCTKVSESGDSNTPSEEILRYELQAETLLTSALRDKIFSKQRDVEQLQAELAAAVRGNDILRYEIQNAKDSLSCATQRQKDLELQMLKKEENINSLQNDLQDLTKELVVMREMLPKAYQERELMWEEVQRYSEQNMLLNSEVKILRKKIDALDEDVLLKEGQITILKDSLRNTKFSLLANPEQTHEF